jgi:hypothetical protein
MKPLSVPCSRWTYLGASTVSYALVPVEGYMGSGIYGFRIAAPHASEGTSLQEDDGSYSGSVVQAVTLYIEDPSFDVRNGPCFSRVQKPAPFSVHRVRRGAYGEML